MEEDIKIIKEKLSIIESLCTDDCINKSVVIEPLKYNIENLIKVIKYIKKDKIQQDYIPKSIIKARIEKLKVLAEAADDEILNACELDIRKNQIYLLQSILQEGDDK